MADAVVVGSGPNGLAAAVELARSGLSVTVLEAADTIGGGTRTEELTVPGLRHDVCSAVHPFGVISPFLAGLDLAAYGLNWCAPEVDLAHPLDGGRAGVLVQSLDETARGLGADAKAWRRTFAHLVDGFDDLAIELLQPILHVPHHPIRMARFGLDGLRPATWLTHRFVTDEAKGLFAGAAAHAIHPLNRPTTSAIGLMLIASGHRVGWSVAEGGSAAVTNALASLLESLGGTITTGVRVERLSDVPPAKVTLFDVGPAAMARIAGDALPGKVRRTYEKYRNGPGAFKIDLAVRGGIPWTADAARRAGTVHVGGTVDEIARAEHDVHRGKMPERPFVLVAQQYLADPSRSVGDVHPVWAYCHVPMGFTGDATEAILDQIERFAPGTRDTIVEVKSRGPAVIEADNANFVGGDIATGANDPLQVVFRPRFALDPYRTGIPGVYLCSAATPPGGGVHGMCGFHAARSALRHLEGHDH